MGTRGSVGFIQQEKPALSYNHFDSYPDGLGSDVLGFIFKINLENGWELFKERAAKLKNIEEKLITDTLIMEKYEKYSNLGVSEQKLSDPYCLFREIQGYEWMNEVYKGELEHYPLNNDFIKSSLFCEYAYIINLDTMKLEFYDGYQKKQQIGNKFGEETNEDGYYPCRLVCVFDLLNINNTEVVSDITHKMQKVCQSNADDPSVINYFRKPKLEILNEKASE